MTDDRPVIDMLIGIFSLDDDPGKLIRQHYVTTETERLRWLAELEQLRDAANLLARLQAAGVDNWEGYEEACDQ